MEVMDVYYFINWLWPFTNKIMIFPFILANVVRYFNIDINKKLWTDHLSRICLAYTVLFYFVDIYVKYIVDGAENLC